MRPTLAGVYWLLTILALLATAINYANNLIFALAFMLLALALQSGWQGWLMLRQLDWQASQPQAVFAGSALTLCGQVHGTPATASFSLCQGRQQGAWQGQDAQGQLRVWLQQPGQRRGRLSVAALSIVTRWPLGLWQLRRSLPAMEVLIYPQPHGRAALPAPAHMNAQRHSAGDDFQGLRAYAAGDSPRRINWRAFGRLDELVVNCYDGDSGGQVRWLSWEHTQGLGDDEQRLSQLAAWVLAAERLPAQAHGYGLRLPGLQLPAGRGPTQRTRCLQALALYGSDQPINPPFFS